MYISLEEREFCGEHVHIDLRNVEQLEDCIHELNTCKNPPHNQEERILRVFQITDTHLGPYMSLAKLKRICENVVKREHEIDLVIITGDMETFDTHHDEHALRLALDPLKKISEKVVACLGNHDYEVLEKVRNAFKENNIRLLEDDQHVIQIKRWHSRRRNEQIPNDDNMCNNEPLTSNINNLVQIVGSVYKFAGIRESTAHIQELCTKFPRISSDIPRLFLIHNPLILNYMPLEETGTMIFSGHYHGGQIGITFKRLTIFKVLFFVVRKVLKMDLSHFRRRAPDQGYYGRSQVRLYSHRGTGHGFPLRMAIPTEQSLIHLYY
ncbi:hypothetical protein C9374_002182 [Naegleria lovaniensis]|uniref:Calcineurin-like phosphoesterase domain-containing protein n=1 Tax=Naegleria lovaniensis TaxID=51637 RepID=A0AA88KL67_NAELO|nr:uncharacterized protein C9374_002182 [Naegleria lovaniensis]KAG2386438.1 hypothetical protein C9374_002182 [Naegleria lovaniensis]